VALGYFMERDNKNFIVFLFSILLFWNILAWMMVFDLTRSSFLEINFFDVGQGDAIFIETPPGHQILIDGGPDMSVLEKLGKEMPFYDRTIDLIILTHPEHDHVAGLIEVLKRYKVENILWTGVLRDTAEYQEWEKVLTKEQEEANIYIAKAGQKIIFSSTLRSEKGGEIKVLFPFQDLEGQTMKNTNNTSIVTKLIFGESSFLFTGDAYKVIERKLSEEKINLDSDILKVSHHGSKTSTDEEFLKRVSPKVAVISVSKDNHYGHPHPETLAVLNKYDINILRTDRDGDIKMVSDGRKLEIKADEKISRLDNIISL